MHIRAAIRAAAGSILATAIPTATVHVARSRPKGGRGDGIEVVEVFTPRERSERQAAGFDRIHDRVIDLMVVGHATDKAGSEDAADAIDALALAVEQALADDPTLGGIVADCALAETDLTLDPAAFAGANFAQTWRVHATTDLDTM